ncbi:DUF6232 family protein [Streptomyces sp. R28]|uniref:DUF6232 family protein n=1 Tax=Streptomyces sp. R28 TaxID=3238628 RepID=A0AB39Q7A2_9ACTN
MAFKREVISVRVSRRILWIGAEAYPLNNIARAQVIKIVPARAAAVGRFLSQAVLCVVIWVAARALSGEEQVLSDAGPGFLTIATVVALGVLVIATVKLLSVLLRRHYFALVIETAGTPRTALVSADPNLVDQLVVNIMDAIDNPQAAFSMQVENFHLGDKIQQFGDRNVGKVA